MTTTIPAGWLPIESAPKDGTPVLLFARLAGVNFATNSPYAPTIHVGAYRTDLCIWTGSAYRNQLEIEIEPTHWMPRPAFPDCAAPGVSTVEDAQDERQADACPRCEGSGEITVMSDNSPDAHDVVVCCDHCQGSGAAVDAAKYLAAALAGEKYRHMQVWAEYRNFHRSLCARFGYGHDEVHFRRDLVSLEEAIAAKVAAPAAGDTLTAAARDVLAERQRQISAEGWTPEQDDRYTHGDMASAAACYANQGRYHFPEPGKPGPNWPWAAEWWKPSTYRRNLEKAGALILAEIERLDRAAQRKGDA